MEGYNNNNNNDNNNQGFFGRPQGVWESEFPVGNSFLLRGTEKKTQTLDVVWEQIYVVCYFLDPFLLTKLFVVPPFLRAQREENLNFVVPLFA